MSGGELFDLIRPVAIIVSSLLSTWVFASARRRYSLPKSLAWAFSTLILPLVVFPIYLVFLIVSKHERLPAQRFRFLLPIAYLVTVLTSIGTYLYFDSRSADAHIARATQARLDSDWGGCIIELQKALDIEDNPHTHKLLAIQLAQSGYYSDAISEFRIALREGEPDDSIHFRLGILLEKINQPGQAQLEYGQFLLSKTCMTPNPACESARQSLHKY